MRPLIEPFILSVSGRDRPGILATMAAALAEAGIDIVDIEQATLQDFLALSFLVDLEGDAGRSRRLLCDVLPQATGLGLAVDVRGLAADEVRVLKETDHAVLVLISEKPSSRLIAELGAATARHQANIVSIRRLAEEDLRAGEFVLDVSRVPSLDALKADLLLTAERLGADAGLAREDVYRKSKRVVVFDMDGTLVAGETLDILAVRAGVGAEVAPITREAMEGRIEFGESLRRRVALLRGLPESVLHEVARGLELSPGAEEALRVLKRLGYRLAVVSGGVSVIVEALRERLDLDYAFGNTLEVEEGMLTGRVCEPILDGPGKARVLAEIAAKEGVSLEQVVGVGDGANDIPMLQAAGLGIAFRAKERTRESAHAALSRSDFLGLLYLLGVSGRDLKRLRAEGTGEHR
jgi:phosphoserine phosphatase